LKPPYYVRILGQVLGNDLDGDLFARANLLSFVDSPHPAFTKFVEDAIAPVEHLAGLGVLGAQDKLRTVLRAKPFP